MISVSRVIRAIRVNTVIRVIRVIVAGQVAANQPGRPRESKGSRPLQLAAPHRQGTDPAQCYTRGIPNTHTL